MKFLKPVPLSIEHRELLDSFDCQSDAINDWLKRHVIKNQLAGVSRSYLVFDDNNFLAGYFSVRVGVIDHSVLSAAFKKNLPNPLPILLLGRLGVDVKYQGLGLAKAMVYKTISLGYEVASVASCWAVVVEPLTENLTPFYLKLGFIKTKAERPLLIFRLQDKNGDPTIFPG